MRPPFRSQQLNSQTLPVSTFHRSDDRQPARHLPFVTIGFFLSEQYATRSRATATADYRASHTHDTLTTIQKQSRQPTTTNPTQTHIKTAAKPTTNPLRNQDKPTARTLTWRLSSSRCPTVRLVTSSSTSRTRAPRIPSRSPSDFPPETRGTTTGRGSWNGTAGGGP